MKEQPLRPEQGSVIALDAHMFDRYKEFAENSLEISLARKQDEKEVESWLE